jgi:hypothetical protein
MAISPSHLAGLMNRGILCGVGYYLSGEGMVYKSVYSARESDGRRNMGLQH